MWRCLLPTRWGGWVVVKSLWWRTVCTYCCRSLQRPCTAAFGVPKSSRWLTQAPQVSRHRGLAVSVSRHRDSDRGGGGGGGGGAHKPDTGVSEEVDHHSFEKVLLLASVDKWTLSFVCRRIYGRFPTFFLCREFSCLQFWATR